MKSDPINFLICFLNNNITIKNTVTLGALQSASTYKHTTVMPDGGVEKSLTKGEKSIFQTVNHHHNTNAAKAQLRGDNPRDFFFLVKVRYLYLIPGNTVICNRICSITSRPHYL